MGSFLKGSGLEVSFNGSRLEVRTLSKCPYSKWYFSVLTSRSAKAATGQLVELVDCDQSQVVILCDYGLRSGPLRAGGMEAAQYWLPRGFLLDNGLSCCFGGEEVFSYVCSVGMGL
jgi:hypothetical protein